MRTPLCWLIASALSALLPVACVQPGPAVDIDATVTARVQATLEALPSPTPLPTATPTPTPTAIPTPTPSPTSTPTPTSTPVPLTAAEILALSRGQLEDVETLRVEMSAEFQSEDFDIRFRLYSEIELPDRFHGTLEGFGERQEFLRLGEEDYIAEDGFGFERDEYDQSGGTMLELLEPLLRPGADEPFIDLQREPDETLEGRGFYRLTFRMDMGDFIERFYGEEQPVGDKTGAQGELLIDQESLLPHRFMVLCGGCLDLEGMAMDLVTDFTLLGFNEPVLIPGPEDEPSLLPTPEPASPTSHQASETASVQTSMDSMMADRGISSVAPSADSTNSWSGNPTGTGAVPLYPDYMRFADTLYFYCWDSTGKITDVYEAAEACPPSAAPAPAPEPAAVEQIVEVDELSAAFVQTGMDIMMADRGISSVAPSADSTNSWSDNPTGTGAVPLYPDYMPFAGTYYFYCWNSTGKIIDVHESSEACPLSVVPAALQIKGSIIAHEEGATGNVHRIEIPVMVIAGSTESVDLSSASLVVTYIDANQVVDLAQDNNAEFSTTTVSGWDTVFRAGDSGSVLDPGERADFVVNISGLTTRLTTSTEFTIQIKPAIGAILSINRTTPGEITTITNLD